MLRRPTTFTKQSAIVIVDFSALNGTERYKIMSSCVIPRPIAWIVTEDEGVLNVAPFSYFTALSSNPATLLVSVGHKSDGSPKDTLRNILQQQKATICITDERFLEAMHASAKPFDVSEVEALNLQTQTVINDFPPIIEGIKVAFFCTFHSKVDLKGSKTIPLILEIQHYYGEDIETFDAIGRVGKEYIIKSQKVALD